MKAYEEIIQLKPDSNFNLLYRSDDKYKLKWHYHRHYELTLICNGTGWRYIGSSVERYNGPELVLLPPNLPHSWASINENEKKQEAYVLQFDKNALGNSFIDSNDFHDVNHLLKRNNGLKFENAICEKVLPLLKEFQDLSGISRIQSFITILSILKESDYLELSESDYSPSLDNETNQKMDTIINWIQEKMREKIYVEDAAKLIYMSESTFRRFFKKNTGKSFVDYINELRINSACQMFTHEGYNISDAAMECGFNNLSHFNRLFSKMKGVSPRKYKQLFRV